MDELSTIILAAALIIIMLGLGLGLVIEDFKRIVLYPRSIIIGLINQLVLLPLIGFGIATILDLPAEIAIGIMILAACPGGATSNLIAHLAKADVALSVTLTAISSLITIIIVNFALVHFLDESQMIRLDVLQTIGRIMVIIVGPVAIGMTIRQHRENFAHKMARPVRIASAILLALVIIGIVIKEKDNVISYFEQAGIAALLLNLISMGIGYFTATIFRVRKDRSLSIAIESGIQNGTLAIMIASVLLQNTSFAIAPAVYSLLMFFTGGLVIYWGMKRADKDQGAVVN